MVAVFGNATPAYANSAANASDSFPYQTGRFEIEPDGIGYVRSRISCAQLIAGASINGTSATKVEVAVPSINPVEVMKFSSGYGYRNAPTRGASRNHKGIDIPGPVGTPNLRHRRWHHRPRAMAGRLWQICRNQPRQPGTDTLRPSVGDERGSLDSVSARVIYWVIWALRVAPQEAICTMKCASQAKPSIRWLFYRL